MLSYFRAQILSPRMKVVVLKAVPLIALAILLSLVTGPVAHADAIFHTVRVQLERVSASSDSLRSGTVVDVHANGPQIFTHEEYHLVGAQPNATYNVQLKIYPSSSTCGGDSATIPSSQITTNASGAGNAKLVLSPSAVPTELRGTTIGVVWQVLRGGAVQYQSVCVAVALD